MGLGKQNYFGSVFVWGVWNRWSYKGPLICAWIDDSNPHSAVTFGGKGCAVFMALFQSIFLKFSEFHCKGRLRGNMHFSPEKVLETWFWKQLSNYCSLGLSLTSSLEIKLFLPLGNGAAFVPLAVHACGARIYFFQLMGTTHRTSSWALLLFLSLWTFLNCIQWSKKSSLFFVGKSQMVKS